MEEAKKKLLVRSMIIGGIIGSVVVASRSNCNMNSCVKSCYKSTTDFLKFMNENRDEIISQIKNTSDKVTKSIDETNHDLKNISENIKKLKTSSSQMITTVQKTKDELLNMYESCKLKYDTEALIENLDEKNNA